MANRLFAPSFSVFYFCMSPVSATSIFRFAAVNIE